MTLDPERDMQRMHTLIFSHMMTIEMFLPKHDRANSYSTENSLPFAVDDVKACYETLDRILQVAYELEHKHRTYQRMLANETKYGSK